jgi:hypothetical protein
MPSILLRSAAMAVVLLSTACAAPTLPATAPAGAMPAYGGRGAELFDDAIEPLVSGFTMAPTMPAELDPELRERILAGDHVVRARVVTVTTQRAAGGAGWQIALHTLERLAGRSSPDADFTIDVAPTVPAAAVLRVFEDRLVGAEVIAFDRAFARRDGSAEQHFHVTPVGEDRLRAVRSVALLVQAAVR